MLNQKINGRTKIVQEKSTCLSETKNEHYKYNIILLYYYISYYIITNHQASIQYIILVINKVMFDLQKQTLHDINQKKCLKNER